MNAVKHGLLSRRLSPASAGSVWNAEYESNRDDLVQQYGPRTAVEIYQTRQLAALMVNSDLCLAYLTAAMTGKSAARYSPIASRPGTPGVLELQVLEAIVSCIHTRRPAELDRSELAFARQTLLDVYQEMLEGPRSDQSASIVKEMTTPWVTCRLREALADPEQFAAVLADPAKLGPEQREAWLHFTRFVLFKVRGEEDDPAMARGDAVLPARLENRLPDVGTFLNLQERFGRQIDRLTRSLEQGRQRRKAARAKRQRLDNSIPKFVEPAPEVTAAINNRELEELMEQDRRPAEQKNTA